MVQPADLRPDEEYLLAAVDEALRRELGPELGRRTVHDARGATALRVDVAYETPGIAVELTSLQDPVWAAATSEVAKLESRLTAFANLHDLGGWTIGLIASCDVAKLEAAVKPLMMNGESFAPMQYSSRDLTEADAAGNLAAFLQQHRRLRDLGLSLLHPAPSRVSVATFVSAAGFQITGFGDLLDATIAANADKLAEARPRQTHLAILVVRWDVSDSPGETAPPVLPSAIDRLWVVHPRRGGTHTRVWSLRRGEAVWRVHVVTA